MPDVTWYRKRRLKKDGAPYQENLWHSFLMSTYSAAATIWWQECEEHTSLYDGDVREYKIENPCPQLKDFMIRLGREWSYADAA